MIAGLFQSPTEIGVIKSNQEWPTKEEIIYAFIASVYMVTYSLERIGHYALYDRHLCCLLQRV